jgi:hypothetical protein
MNKPVNPKQLDLAQELSSEELILATAPHIDPDLVQQAPPSETKDPTAAERQRRYRKRHARDATERNGSVTRDGDRNADTVTRDDVTLLCDRQDKIEISFNDDGDAVITQSSWPDEDSIILVSRDNIPQFIDRLSDALGIPSFGRPRP